MKKQNNNSHFRPSLIMTIVAVCLLVSASFGIYSMVKDYGWFGGYEAGMTLNEMEAVPSGWFKRSVKTSIKEHSQNTPQNEDNDESFVVVPPIEHVSRKWNVDGCYEFDSDMVVTWIELRYIYFEVPTPEECGDQTAVIFSEFAKERSLDVAGAVSFADYEKAYEHLQQRQLLRMMPSPPPNMMPLAPSNQPDSLLDDNNKTDFFALYYWEHDGKRTSFSAVRSLDESDTPNFILFFTEAVTAASENSQVQGPDEPSGAAAIRQYYSQKAEKDTAHDYSHMDLDTLDGLASGTIGNVVDTDELSIDVMGAVISRNAAEIVLRITAKQLDTLVYDNGIPPLSNYRFSDETALFGRQTFGEKTYSADHWYTYSQSDGRLAGNQCELHYFIRYPEPLETDNLIIPLTDFGYYKTAAEFVPVYENTWQVSIANDALSDSSRMIGGEREITVGDYRMSVEDITVSPLMCSFRLVCLEDEAVTGENMSSMINACFSEKDRFFLTLADGTILDGTQLDIGGSVVQQYPLIFTWTLPYPGPLNVDTVSAVTIFDCTIPLR